MKRIARHLVALLAATLVAGEASPETIEPRKIHHPSELRPGEGAVLLSVRHQVPVIQTMHVRFVSATDPKRIIKFERKVGLGGRTRMLAREVNIYAVPAGHWILASHLAGCDDTIKPGEECILTIGSHSYPLPSATYPDDWFAMDVVDGGLTDANELSLEVQRKLESTPGNDETPEARKERIRSLRFKTRQLPAADKAFALEFRQLRTGQVVASPAAASEIVCERPAQDLKRYFNPFTC